MSLRQIELCLLVGLIVVVGVFLGAVRGIFRPKSLPLVVLFIRELWSRRRARPSDGDPNEEADPPSDRTSRRAA